MAEREMPEKFPVYAECIPSPLIARDAWLGCNRRKQPQEKISSTRTVNASWTTRSLWQPFDEVLEDFAKELYAGVGTVIESPLVGVDLDHARDPATGKEEQWAREILTSLDSYTEVSPSGTGYKVWGYAPGLKRGVKYAEAGGEHVEVYVERRYFTVTGQITGRYPDSLAEFDDAVRELVAYLNAKRHPSKRPRAKTRRSGQVQPSWDIEQVISESGVAVFAEAVDGTACSKYRIRCPWYGEHTGGDESGTYLGQYPDGAVFFFCNHAHCEGRGWSEFREKTMPAPKITRSARRVRTYSRKVVS